MTAVWSCNDWDPLEEVVLGTARGLHLPPLDTSLRHFFEPPQDAEHESIPDDVLRRVVEETEEDLSTLTDLLTQAGVAVRRPQTPAADRPYATPDWESAGSHALMPRDCLLVIGDRVIEVPMAVRSRYFETAPYRTLLREYFDGGATWLAAPKPQLPEETYVYEPGRSVVAEIEPLFDAANVLRCGRDVFFNVTNTGNRLGAEWLRRTLGAEFRVHEVSVSTDHIDTTLHVLRPGLLLANSARLTPETLPEQFRSWKTIWAETPDDDGYAFGWPRASVWIGMNILSLGPDLALVPEGQKRLARQLEEAGVAPVLAPFRHGRTLGGGFHCCSLDVRRRGELGDVF